MAKGGESGAKEGAAEKTSRFFRNINVLGAVAAAGAAVVLPAAVAPALSVWAGVNAVQAGGFELGRRHFAKKRGRK
ncbi:MAG TPA: hypothetical protein VJ836_05350 [Candidatus Saccharimonadales bacterium]|nr:hypothetical protein [Candidatus Saccharimonadales bacterium]